MRGRRTGRTAARPRRVRGGWPAVRSRVVRGGWPAVRPWVVRAGAAAGVVVAYFLLPLDHLGPQRPVLSWLLFALILTVVAVLLLRQIRHVLVDRPDSRPGMVLSLLTACPCTSPPPRPR